MSDVLDRSGLLLTAAAVALTAGLVWIAATVSPFLALGAAIALVVFIYLGTDRTGLLCLLLAFGTAPMSRGIERFSGGIGTPTDLLLIMAWPLLLPGLAHRRLGLPTAWTIGLLTLASFALLGSAAWGTGVASLPSWFQWIFFLGGLPILIAWLRPGRPLIVKLLWAYVVGHMVSTAIGLLEGKDPITGRYDGLTIHPNGFGLAGLVAIAALFYLYDHHQDGFARLFVIGAGVMALGSIWLSGSRSALAVAIALTLLLPLVERSALSGFGIFGLATVGVVAAPMLISMAGDDSALGRLLGGGSATVADQERETALSDGIDRFIHSPFTGSGLFQVELIHNLYVEVAVAAGIVGLVSYLVVIGTLARPLFGDHPERRLSWMVWAVIGIAAALPGLWDRTIWVAASLAILPALARDPDEPGDAEGPTAPEALPALRA